METHDKNSELYDEASDAIDMLLNDVSVSKEHTRSNIKALIEELQIRLDTL